MRGISLGRVRITPQRVLACLRAWLVHPLLSTTAWNLVLLASNALAGAVAARELGPAGRGWLVLVVLWAGYIHLLGSLGMQSACTYYVARLGDRRAALARWFRRVAIWQAVAMSLVSAVVFGSMLGILRAPPLLALEYIAWPSAATLTLYGACLAQGTGNFRRFNAIRVLPSVATPVLMLGVATVARLTPGEAGGAYLIPVMSSAVFGYLWLREAETEQDVRPLGGSEVRLIWSYARRSVASLSSLALNRSADQFILGLVVSVGMLGTYSVAGSVTSPVVSIVASLGMVGMPTVAALTGPAKAAASRRALFRAGILLAVVAPPVAALLPWAVPAVYGSAYADAVVPAEMLLAGAAFAALATVADDLLRAYGCPGFVSVTQGLGAVVTLAGTLAVRGRPLVTVALVSSAGFLLAFVLAVARLRRAARQEVALSAETPLAVGLAPQV